MKVRSEEEADPAIPPAIPIVTGWKKPLFLLAAGFFFVLGIIGIVVPGLPTTPLLLLTSYFLVRTSPKLNNLLLESRFVGPILTDWQVKRGVRQDIKVKAICVVLIAVSATIYFTEARPAIVAAIIFVAAIGVGVIARLPIIKS